MILTGQLRSNLARQQGKIQGGDKRQGGGYSGDMITNRRLRNALENADWGNDNKEKSRRGRESEIGNGEGKARSERSQISKITMPMARRNREKKKMPKLNVGYP
jgi:hypothetical protein